MRYNIIDCHWTIFYDLQFSEQLQIDLFVVHQWGIHGHTQSHTHTIAIGDTQRISFYLKFISKEINVLKSGDSICLECPLLNTRTLVVSKLSKVVHVVTVRMQYQPVAIPANQLQETRTTPWWQMWASRKICQIIALFNC